MGLVKSEGLQYVVFSFSALLNFCSLVFPIRFSCAWILPFLFVRHLLLIHTSPCSSPKRRKACDDVDNWPKTMKFAKFISS